MKTIRGCRSFLILLLSLSFAILTQAQQGDRNILSSRKSADGRIRFLKFESSRSGQPTIDTSVANIKKILNLGSRHSLLADKSFKDELIAQLNSKGDRYTRYHQYFNGIKVEFGLINIHTREGSLQNVSGEYFQLNDNFSTSPTLSVQAALQKALDFIGAKKYSWQNPDFVEVQLRNEPKGELVICRDFVSSKSKDSVPRMRLAYKFSIYALDPLRYDHIYVDAIDGKILLVDAIIKHVDGQATTKYSGSRIIATTINPSGSFVLKDSSDAYHVATYNLLKGSNYSIAPLFSDNDNNWTPAEYNNSNFDNSALDAHWGAMMTMDYWRTVHNRNSFDNNGAMIRSYVHYGANYSNAFWDGYVMTYGDGNGSTYFPFTTLDICGHEIGHAICQYTANLIYSGESGALNESFSDIWGACIKNFAAPEKNTWLMADEISLTGTPIRSFINPKSHGQPDTYKGTFWYDNADVHINSGVQNHWFYILSVGKSGTNDKGYSYNVTGIGITKAAKIAYRAESTYLFPSATYEDAKVASIQAAEDLFGANSNEVLQTELAWNAVGVYETLPIPLNLNASLSVSSQIDISWAFPLNQTVEGFVLERSINGSNYIQIADLGASIRNYTDQSVAQDAIHSYRIRSYKNGVYSNYSNSVSIGVGNSPYIMQNGTKSGCGYTFLDPGAYDVYGNSVLITTTFTSPVAGEKVRVEFSKFRTQGNYDQLIVYNGPTAQSPIIGVFSGSNPPPTLESSAVNGELTFSFQSDYQVTDSGWVAYVSCFRPLPAPTNLVGTVSSQRIVNLSWIDNSNDETKYVIEKSVNDSLHFLPLTDLLPNTVSYADTNNINAQVFYRVRAYRDTSTSKYSNVFSIGVGNIFIMSNASVTTCETLFLDPGGFGNYPIGGPYTVTFSPADPNKKIKVAFSVFELGPFYDVLNVYDGPTTTSPQIGSFVGTNIPVLESTAPNGELTFVFRSNYNYGYRGWQAMVTCFKPVERPSGLVAMPDNVKKVRLNWWDNTPDETKYTIERSTNANSRFEPIAEVPANTTEYFDQLAPDNSFLYYRIRAVSNADSSHYSDTARIEVGNAPVLMQNATIAACDKVFMDPGGSDVYASSIYYTMTIKPADASKRVRINFSKFNLGSSQLTVFNGSSTFSPLIGAFGGYNLPPELNAYNEEGSLTLVFYAGPISDSGWIANISCVDVVQRPTDLTWVIDSAQRVQLTWTDNANDETAYLVERSISDSLHFSAIATLPSNANLYIDSSAPTNTRVHYRVKGIRNSEFSLYSSVCVASTGNAPYYMMNATIKTYGIDFYDPGGPDKNYGYKYTVITTFKPAVPGQKIRIDFSQFKTQQNGDYLTVYNGPNTSSPFLWQFSGQSYPPPVVSSAPNGELTFLFYTNDYADDSGWVARISCVAPFESPTYLLASLVSTKRVSLQWPDATNETGFTLQRSFGDTLHFTDLAQLSANAINYLDTNAVNNVPIYYRVRANYSTNFSSYSYALPVYTQLCQDLSLATHYARTNIFVKAPTKIVDDSCKIYGSIESAGTTPVDRFLRATLWKDENPQFDYGVTLVPRHFDIAPDDFHYELTSKTKLYFTQEEFDAYNSKTNHAKLPKYPSDISGMTNVRVFLFNGPNIYHNPRSDAYSSLPIEIDPSKVQTTWNTTYNCWEVTADLPGLGGIFLTSKNDTVFACTEPDPLGFTYFKSNIYGSPYQWQKKVNGIFVTLTEGGDYEGTFRYLLKVKNSGLAQGDQFRCLVNGAPAKTLTFFKGNRWNGTVNSDWMNPQNWSCGEVPGENTDILVEAGKLNYPVITADISCRSLTIYSGARVEVAAGVKVNVLH